jgi:hypothetical protein
METNKRRLKRWFTMGGNGQLVRVDLYLGSVLLIDGQHTGHQYSGSAWCDAALVGSSYPTMLGKAVFEETMASQSHVARETPVMLSRSAWAGTCAVAAYTGISVRCDPFLHAQSAGSQRYGMAVWCVRYAAPWICACQTVLPIVGPRACRRGRGGRRRRAARPSRIIGRATRLLILRTCVSNSKQDSTWRSRASRT